MSENSTEVSVRAAPKTAALIERLEPTEKHSFAFAPHGVRLTPGLAEGYAIISAWCAFGVIW